MKLNKEFYSEKEVARLVGISISKLQNDRSRGLGIPYRKIGRLVRYNRNDLLEYFRHSFVETVTPGTRWLEENIMQKVAGDV